MSHPIRHLRNVRLDDKLQAQLEPFINAHRPHESTLNSVQLRREFRPPVSTITPLSFKEICKQVKAL